MFCVSVEFGFNAADHDRFVARMRRQAEDSLRLEPGCRAFEVWISSERPGVVHLHEIYDAASDFDAHLASDHFKSFLADVEPILTSRRLLTWDARL